MKLLEELRTTCIVKVLMVFPEKFEMISLSGKLHKLPDCKNNGVSSVYFLVDGWRCGKKNTNTEPWPNSLIVSTESAGKAVGKQALVKDYLHRAHSTVLKSNRFCLGMKVILLKKNKKTKQFQISKTSQMKDDHLPPATKRKELLQ